MSETITPAATLPAAVYTVRVLCDGEHVEDDWEGSADYEHTAYGRFDSTADFYRRSDPIYDGAEVTVQLIDPAGDIVAETTIPAV